MATTTHASMWPRPRPSFTTILAGFLSILLSLAWMAIGAGFIVLAVVSGAEEEVREQLGGLVDLLDAVRYLFAIFGAVIVIVALMTLVVGWKIFRRRGWARWIQIIFLTGFLIATLFFLFAGASVDPEFRDIGGTLVLGAYAGALGLILLLLILPTTSRDFRRVREWEAPAPQMQVQPVAPPPPPPATTQ